MQAVIFDFYGTLAESPAWGPSWAEMLADVGFELPDDVRDRWWNDGIDGVEHDEHSQSRAHYVAWQQGRMRGMLDECGVPKATQDALIERAREIGGHRHLVAYEETLEVLAELRAAGIALAICSNWDWDLREAIAAAGLTGTVDVVVSSAWVGARKPHRRMYAATLDRLGIEPTEVMPSEVLFVGDTWTCDVEGPRSAGLRPVYVRRQHLGTDKTAPADHRDHDVHHGDDLRAVLDLTAQLTARSRPSQ